MKYNSIVSNTLDENFSFNSYGNKYSVLINRAKDKRQNSIPNYYNVSQNEVRWLINLLHSNFFKEYFSINAIKYSISSKKFDTRDKKCFFINLYYNSNNDSEKLSNKSLLLITNNSGNYAIPIIVEESFSTFSQKRIISTTSVLNNEEYGRVVINNDDEIESKPNCRDSTNNFNDCMGCALAKLWDFNDWKSFTMCTAAWEICIAASMLLCASAPVMPPNTGDTDIIVKGNGYYKLGVNTGSVFLFN